MIDRAQLKDRLAILQADRERTAAMLHILSGAIQECEHWISTLNKNEESI